MIDGVIVPRSLLCAIRIYASVELFNRATSLVISSESGPAHAIAMKAMGRTAEANKGLLAAFQARWAVRTVEPELL